MAAPFVVDLCGFRDSGMPSTSDSHDKGSVEWGQALFDQLDVPIEKPEVPLVGAAVESAVIAHLKSTRPDLHIDRSKPAVDFDQYSHLSVPGSFVRSYQGDHTALDEALELSEKLPRSEVEAALAGALKRAKRVAMEQKDRVQQLITMLPEESMLRLDIAVSSPATAGRLLVGVSAKWSLRTDRAQDCVAQGAKLVNLRRGHMPHYAVLTMEPRPAMLKLIAYGSGSVDCVYHLALDELLQSSKVLSDKRNNPVWPPRMLLERMVAQGRIRPFQALVDEVERLPRLT